MLVRIKAASLCHSDLMQNLRPDDGKTYTLGHEGVGVIEKIHPSVEGKGFRVGDPVGFLCTDATLTRVSDNVFHTFQILSDAATNAKGASHIICSA